jgi:hypothetical protein
MRPITELIRMERRVKNLERMLKSKPGEHWEDYAKGLVMELNDRIAAIRAAWR